MAPVRQKKPYAVTAMYIKYMSAGTACAQHATRDGVRFRPDSSALMFKLPSGVQPPHKLRPGVQPPHKLRPGVQHPHKLRPGVQHPHKLRPGVQHLHKLRPGVQHPHKLQPGVQHPHKLRPGVQHPHKLRPGVQHPTRHRPIYSGTLKPFFSLEKRLWGRLFKEAVCCATRSTQLLHLCLHARASMRPTFVTGGFVARQNTEQRGFVEEAYLCDWQLSEEVKDRVEQ
eukprot:365885-Chlamydomonas_euryale.AAC.11